MTKDEIIAMGNEAALQYGHTYGPEPGDGTIEFLGSFAALVAAKEREACAQIADIQALGWQKSPGANPEAGFIASSNCATAIRARGKPCA